MNPNQDFFDRVKEAVKAKGITIEGLLQSVFDESVTRGTYNTWRRRNNLPRADQAVLMAQELGVSVEYLVTGKEPRYEGMSELRAMMYQWIDDLSEEELQDLDRFLDLIEAGAVVTSLRNKKTGE